MSKNKKIILSALLLAILIILSRFLSIKTPIVKISFGFVPTMLCAIWLGPKWTVLINVLGDLIGATLFPSGAFFIGYTISTGLAALIYGLFMYKKDEETCTEKQFIIRTILAIVLVTLVVNMGLNTLWTSITSGSAFMVLMASRFVKELVMIPIKAITIIFLEKALRKPFNKYLRGEND